MKGHPEAEAVRFENLPQRMRDHILSEYGENWRFSELTFWRYKGTKSYAIAQPVREAS